MIAMRLGILGSWRRGWGCKQFAFMVSLRSVLNTHNYLLATLQIRCFCVATSVI